MEFDKSRVYTAVNADDLKIPSKCVLADTIQELKERKYIDTLVGVADESHACRFVSEYWNGWKYALAYLIEPPAEPKYKPFESVEKAMEAIKKHGGWVKDEGTGCTFLVLGYGIHKEDFSIYIKSEWTSLEDLFLDYVFADDDSPCGELVEEE